MAGNRAGRSPGKTLEDLMNREHSDPVSGQTEERGSESGSRIPSVGLSRDEFSRGQDLVYQPLLAEASVFLTLLVNPCVNGRPDWPSGQGSNLTSHDSFHCCG